MPNHVSTVIIASPEVIHAITREHTPEEHAAKAASEAKTRANYEARTGNTCPYPEERLPARFFDFEMFVPSPPNKEQGGCNSKHDPGVVCWYQWNVENWGTKWDAYSVDVEPTNGDLCRLSFDTAWSHPMPIMEAVADVLAKDFPNEVVEVMYADEDFGSNVGRYRIEGGEAVDFEELSNTPEGLELAAQVKYGRPYAELKAEWDADR